MLAAIFVLIWANPLKYAIDPQGEQFAFHFPYCVTFDVTNTPKQREL